MHAKNATSSRRPRLSPRLAGFAALAALAASLSPRSARAEEEFDLTASKGQVVVTAKGDWHINREFPWKLTVGDTKLDKTKFVLTEKDATVTGAPSGVGKLKGAVCSHDSCHTLEREVIVP
jgi:hypothetical protein